MGQEMGSETARVILGAIYYLMPNFSHFSFITEAANGMTPPAGMLVSAIGYAVVYTTILLTITIMIFSRRNFK